MTDDRSLTPGPFPRPKGRALTADEKRDVMNSITQAWIDCNDLRLGQLLSNVTPLGQDLFYVEDSCLVDLVSDYAGKIKP